MPAASLMHTVEFDAKGYDPKIARDRVNHDTLLMIFDKMDREHKPANIIADELAEHKLECFIGKRTDPIVFKK